MSGNDLPIANIVQISVSEAQIGANAYNTSNLALFTSSAYANSFGSLGYNIYLDPTQVGVDFGTSSVPFLMANSVFSQQPNILAGGGSFIVIPYVVAVQHFALSGIPASGTFTLSYLGNPTANINWNDTAAQIQSKLQAVMGLGQVTVTGSLAAQAINITFTGVYGPLTLLTVGGAGLATSAPAAITITPTTTTVGEIFAQAVARTSNLVQYFGLMPDQILSQADVLAAAAVVQPLNKIAFYPLNQTADVSPGGTADLLRQGTFSQNRAMYYGSDLATGLTGYLTFLSGDAGRALSTAFDGSNTTQNMSLRQIIGLSPDPTMTQAIKDLCNASGAQAYVSYQGVPAVFDSGANFFFDQVYNLRWFVGALQIAGFNFLAQTSTKIPQTESGMDGLKGAYRGVCQQAVTNQYSAPGAWQSAVTFGNQADFLANIAQVGYYIYSTPIAQQSQASRAARQAPLIQIALKEAGAINTSTVVVFVNP